MPGRVKRRMRRHAYDILSSLFSELISAGVDDPFTRYYVAAATAMIGKKDEALQLLEKAIAERRCLQYRSRTCRS